MVQEWNSQFAKAIELMPEVALTSFTVCDASHIATLLVRHCY